MKPLMPTLNRSFNRILVTRTDRQPEPAARVVGRVERERAEIGVARTRYGTGTRGAG